MKTIDLTPLEAIAHTFTSQSKIDLWERVLNDLETNKWEDEGSTISRGCFRIWVASSPFADLRFYNCAFNSNRCPYYLRRTLRNEIFNNLSR